MLDTHMKEPESREVPIKAPVEVRDAVSLGVNFSQRLIEVVAVPYEQEASIMYRGEMWKESFLRGAFDGLEKVPGRIRANRDHDRTKPVGKAVRFMPSREEGLVSEIRIAPTMLGDETLTLANEDVLSASVGFGVRGSDQELDKPFRRIKRAFLDHIAFVIDPAYAGADVLAVREDEEEVDAAHLPPLVTPLLDQVLAWRKLYPRQ